MLGTSLELILAEHAKELWLWAEMEKEADLEVGRTQVVVDLPWGDPLEVVSGLRLDHYGVVDDHVESLVAELRALVHHAYGVLP